MKTKSFLGTEINKINSRNLTNQNLKHLIILDAFKRYFAHTIVHYTYHNRYCFNVHNLQYALNVSTNNQ